MNKKIKMAVMALGLGFSLGVPFSSNAWTCASLCNWADEVCAADPNSGDCFEARRSCRHCYIF